MKRDDIKEEFGVTCPHWEPCDCLVAGADFMADEILKLRAAIERVRALHAADGRNECPQCLEWHWVDWENAQSPCPTIRAVDGDDA